MTQKRITSRRETASLFAQIQQQAPNFFSVYDKDTGELLGQLADLSASGMKLISTQALETNRTIQLRIDLPREINKHEEIIVIAKSVWCNPHASGTLYDIGFHFEAVSRTDRAVIEQLLSILSILVMSSANAR